MSTQSLAIVIEDNEDQNLIFSTAMEQAGYAIESFENGAVAWNRLREITPDLIILDLHIPGISGRDILGSIRGNGRFAETLVFIATADAVQAEELRAQADLVLLKPVSFSQLTLLASRCIPKS